MLFPKLTTIKTKNEATNSRFLETRSDQVHGWTSESIHISQNRQTSMTKKGWPFVSMFIWPPNNEQT